MATERGSDVSLGGNTTSGEPWGLLLGPLLFFSLFLGTVGAAGFIAIFPSAGMRPASLVCDGEVELQSHHYSYRPGQQGVSRSFFCVAENGERRDITGRTMGASSAYYSAIVFVLLLLRAGYKRLKRKSTGTGRVASNSVQAGTSARDEAGARRDERIDAMGKALEARLRTSSDYVRRDEVAPDARSATSTPPPSAQERLRAIDELRRNALISEDEYRAKRAEILRDL